MANFFRLLVQFLKDILLFGLDAFMIAASREIARRFWVRLEARGGAIAAIDAPKQQQQSSFQRVPSYGSSQGSFLEEYQD